MIIIKPSDQLSNNTKLFDIIANKLDDYLDINISSHVAAWNSYDDDIMIINDFLNPDTSLQYIDNLAELIQSYDIIYVTGSQNVTKKTLQSYVISKKFINALNQFMTDFIYDTCTIFPKYTYLLYTTSIIESFVPLFDGYKYYHNKDSVSGDVAFLANKTVYDLALICNTDTQILGFNTFGYVKSSIKDDLINMSSGGIYIKQNNDIITQRINDIVNRCDTLDITFTITTCKRWSLFKKTMDSLLLACNDLHLIREFICIDDNSDIYDRILMKLHYPFFKFIFKTPEQKGHAKSLNMLWQHITTTFVMHFEDDWLCHEHFLIKDILQLRLDHIILRRNCRGEHIAINDRLWKYVYNPKNYCKPFDNKLYDIEFMTQNNIDPTNFFGNSPIDTHWWWPGFSLNPCVFNFSKYKKIGLFNENIKPLLFEYDFALRCYFNNLETYFTDLYIEHIGEISSYSLNNTNRDYDPIIN